MPAPPRPPWIDAERAAHALGIKRATLYTYASRGLIRTARGPDGRTRRYSAEDVDELARRAAAAAGHEAAAASALDWGAPVLASAVSSIDVDGPNYRGVPACWLAERDVPFDAVASLLWTGELPDPPPVFRAPDLGLDPRAVDALLPPNRSIGAVLALVTAGLHDHTDGWEDPSAWGATLHRFAAWSALATDRPGAAQRAERAIAVPGVAHALAIALDAPAGAARWLDRALVTCADHELNASTFAARVAASTGASPYACLAAGLAAWSGPRHGGSADRLETLVRAGGDLAHLADATGDGGDLPGFDHRLYPAGDPRGERLLLDARSLDATDPASLALERLVTELTEAGHAPNLDGGLVALALALGLPRGAAGVVFAVGRTAGWLAHAAEQRRSPRILRPRARYTGR